MKRLRVRVSGGGFVFAPMDDEDFARFDGQAWYRNRFGYVRRGVNVGGGVIKTLHLAREVLALPADEGRQVDHVNRDKLDNRRENLRLVTPAQNSQNRGSRPSSVSRFRGVTFNPTGRGAKPWRARVRIAGVLHDCGRHADEIDAALAAEAFRAEHMTHAEPEETLVALGLLERTTA